MTVKDYSDKLWKSIREGTKRGVFNATEETKNEIFRLISNTPKTGRVYVKPGGRLHQASAPGEPFANDTFHAISNIETRYSTDGLEGFIDANFEYAMMLEFGTGKMAARPFLRPGIENSREYVIQEIQDQIDKALEQGLAAGLSKSLGV